MYRVCLLCSNRRCEGRKWLGMCIVRGLVEENGSRQDSAETGQAGQPLIKTGGQIHRRGLDRTHLPPCSTSRWVVSAIPTIIVLYPHATENDTGTTPTVQPDGRTQV